MTTKTPKATYCGVKNICNIMLVNVTKIPGCVKSSECTVLNIGGGLDRGKL
jgi:hypothetical protein